MRIYDGRTHFSQWDKNVMITSTDFKIGDEVHITNNRLPNAMSVLVYEYDGKAVIDVPNILLQTSYPIIVFRYIKEGNSGYTIDKKEFGVNQKPKPDDYVYTETEVLNYSSLSKRIDNLEGEGLSKVVSDYLKENPVQAGATKDEAKQIEQNKTNIEKLTQDKLDTDKLPEAVNSALAQAKETGLFDGADGHSPIKGTDYWTEADKAEIKGYVDEAILGGAW